MFRIFKYLKPYWLLIVIAIALLFVQANADLALPDYLSNIVNYGIQQSGVSNAVPVAIRQSEMNRLAMFMSAADAKTVLNDFTLVDTSSPDYAKYLKDYPKITGPVYILNKINKAENTKLNNLMGKPWLVVSFIEQIMVDPSKASAMKTSGSGGCSPASAGTGAGAGGGFSLTTIPAGTDLFALLAKMPSALTAIQSTINCQFATLGDSMITQTAVGPVKAEYTALGMDVSRLQTNYILNTGALMLLVSLLSITCTIIVGYLSARTAAGSARDLRKSVFKKVESFSNSELDKFSTASLITRSTNDVTQIQMVVIMMMRMVIYAPIIGVGGVIRALGKSTSMWWIIALAVIVLLGLIMTVFSISLPKFKIMQTLIDRLNLVTRENLSGMMVIRAFNRQDFELKRFDKANVDLTSTGLFVNRVMVTMFPIMMLIMNGLTVGIIWVGAHQVAASTMQVGDMIAFMQYALQIVFAFLMMSFMFIILPRAQVSANRIADVLETKPLINDPVSPEEFKMPFQGTIEFRDVSFRYPGGLDDALCDVSFTAKPGQTTAIIGPTGAGKSTIVNLIPRFYEVTGGAIYVDGTDIRQVTQHALREKIGYVPQKSTLFSGTVESNLRYADENASTDTIKESATIAQACEFIDAKPEGYDAEISQGGTNVSGGQKQRLSIARALVKRAPIYLFDDSFSALDFKTDATLRRALKEKTGESTLLIVTQRVATVKNADQILVMDDGKLVGKGTHRDLMATCETYREIASSQLSKEELA